MKQKKCNYFKDLRFKIFFLLFFVCVPTFLYGQTVLKIEVKGNRRVGQEAILNQVTQAVGKDYQTSKIRKSIQNIYALGFFENIEVHSESLESGVNLTFWVVEKPAIRKIEYQGYSKVSLSSIKEVVDLKEYDILDLSKIQKNKEKIIKMYEQKGFFLAQVKHDIVQDKKANEVDLVFKIEELDKVKIRKINFIGNSALSDDDLKSVMATKEGNLLSWLTKSDSYQEEVFKGDLESLTYFYHTKGYVQVKITAPVITVSADKRWVYIVVPVEEGEQFYLGDLDYSGDLLFAKDTFTKDRKIISGQLFNREELRQEVLRLADLYKDQGFAFANVNVQSAIDDKAKKVNLVFDFEKGEKVYFGKIRIKGNSNTRDKVIRRELKVFEGDLYSETQLRKSIDRVRALGFFSDVTYTKPQGEKLSEVDLNIDVTERSTGALTVGAGWSSVDKFVANAQISHTNLLGRGQAVSLNAQLSGGDNGSTRFSTSFTEPYTFDSLWSSGFDAYNTETRTTNFTELKTGGDLRVGHPIGELTNTYLTYKLEDVRLKDVTNTSSNDIRTPGVISSMLGTIVYDARNNRFEPSKGIYDQLSTEFAGLGGDNNYFKSILKSRFYYPAYFNGVLRLNVETGFLVRTTDKILPATERFFLGGVNSLRGFKPFSIGPTGVDNAGKEVLLGGDRQLFANLEYELPLIRQMGIKGVLFYDIGSAFNGLDIGKVRQDVGFGFRWFSPFGPLRVEVGFPLDPQPGEKKQNIEFAITPPF
ncbi:MAG: outer membrane protein assembly factor BamA [Deltaproteobacteria bacterium RIFCSPHIGHO2_02_FULL_40_11]|nr:MAG: outer membrane protein assembly factor BamA [Deltaproteobacteria bacterium RIFCSPHIGHO2_02_FULL_40_11]